MTGGPGRCAPALGLATDERRALGGEWEFKGRAEAREGDRAAAQAEFRLEAVDPIPINGTSRTQLGRKGRLKVLSAKYYPPQR